MSFPFLSGVSAGAAGGDFFFLFFFFFFLIYLQQHMSRSSWEEARWSRWSAERPLIDVRQLELITLHNVLYTAGVKCVAYSLLLRIKRLRYSIQWHQSLTAVEITSGEEHNKSLCHLECRYSGSLHLPRASSFKRCQLGACAYETEPPIVFEIVLTNKASLKSSLCSPSRLRI